MRTVPAEQFMTHAEALELLASVGTLAHHSEKFISEKLRSFFADLPKVLCFENNFGVLREFEFLTKAIWAGAIEPVYPAQFTYDLFHELHGGICLLCGGEIYDTRYDAVIVDCYIDCTSISFVHERKDGGFTNSNGCRCVDCRKCGQRNMQPGTVPGRILEFCKKPATRKRLMLNAQRWQKLRFDPRRAEK